MSYLDLDLSKVKTEDRPTTPLLQNGTHEVMIEKAEVGHTAKGHDQLVVTYKNDKGIRKQWILFGHDNPMTRDIALGELKSLLTAIGHTANNPPDVGWYTGKPVKISIWKGKSDNDSKVKATERSVNFSEVKSSDFSGADLEDEIPFG
mgnify:CR=1 FL=1